MTKLLIPHRGGKEYFGRSTVGGRVNIDLDHKMNLAKLEQSVVIFSPTESSP
jgi:hypothetical protein